MLFVCFSVLSKKFFEKLEKKKLTLEFEIDPTIEVYVDWERFIEYVLKGFLSNAVTFSHEGKKIRIIGKKSSYREIQILIKDEGIGIPVRMIPNLGIASKSSKRKGTAGETGEGFGIPLAKQLLSYFDGDVFINSVAYDKAKPELLHGTEVTLILRGR